MANKNSEVDNFIRNYRAMTRAVDAAKTKDAAQKQAVADHTNSVWNEQGPTVLDQAKEYFSKNPMVTFETAQNAAKMAQASPVLRDALATATGIGLSKDSNSSKSEQKDTGGLNTFTEAYKKVQSGNLTDAEKAAINNAVNKGNADDYVEYTYKPGDTFGQVILDLGIDTNKGLWGSDGDVAYYTKQLREQGIPGMVPIGTKIRLKKRK